MSLIKPLKFRTYETEHFKTPRLQTSRLQTGSLQSVITVAYEQCLFYTVNGPFRRTEHKLIHFSIGFTNEETFSIGFGYVIFAQRQL